MNDIGSSRTQDERRGYIISIDDGVAQMIDAATGRSFDISLSAPGGVLPIIGDQWVCIRNSGFWSFERCVSMADKTPQRSFLETMNALIARGLVDPSYPDGTNEGYHLAYIGEIRWFPGAFAPNDRWILANGSFVNRVAYRELAHVYDPVGTSATFQIPGLADASSSVQTLPTNLAYGGGWADYSQPPFQGGQYWRAGSMIHVHGLVQGAAANNGQTIATLPVGFRPTYSHIFNCQMNNLYGRVDVISDGTITLTAVGPSVAVPGPVWVSLAGLSFYSPPVTYPFTVRPYVCARK